MTSSQILKLEKVAESSILTLSHQSFFKHIEYNSIILHSDLMIKILFLTFKWYIFKFKCSAKKFRISIKLTSILLALRVSVIWSYIANLNGYYINAITALPPGCFHLGVYLNCLVSRQPRASPNCCWLFESSLKACVPDYYSAKFSLRTHTHIYAYIVVL
jgi:hypothetical protein